ETDAIRARYRGHPGESAFEVDKFVGERAESLDVPTIDRLLDHIDHAVQVMGIDHVGLGSDFDGISVLPRPLKDAASLPELVRALEARGYSGEALRKILGENFLRVLTAGPSSLPWRSRRSSGRRPGTCGWSPGSGSSPPTTSGCSGRTAQADPA